MSAEIREVSQRKIDFYCVIILTIDSRQLCTLMRDFKKHSILYKPDLEPFVQK